MSHKGNVNIQFKIQLLINTTYIANYGSVYKLIVCETKTKVF